METEVKKKKTLEESGILINKKVKVVSIKRMNDFLPKDGEDLYSGAIFSVTLPLDGKTNQLVQILTKEEQEMFEEELNLPKGELSFYHKDKGFWSSPKGVVNLRKDDNVLNLANPMDYLRYKILLANKRTIAPNWESKLNSGEYRFVIVDEDQETKVNTNKSNLMKEVYKLLGKVEDNTKKMQSILRLYGKRTNNNNVDFLRAEIQKMIDVAPQQFVDIVNDKHFNVKIQIEQALDIKALERTATKGYALKGGDLIGRTLPETIEWFENPINNDIVLRVKAQIEQALNPS